MGNREPGDFVAAGQTLLWAWPAARVGCSERAAMLLLDWVAFFVGASYVTAGVSAALGIGVVNKLLEPLTGAVFGKILVLLFIVLFIQRRPQGIFALQGRAAES